MHTEMLRSIEDILSIELLTLFDPIAASPHFFPHNARFLIEFPSLVIENLNSKRTICTFVYSENFN